VAGNVFFDSLTGPSTEYEDRKNPPVDASAKLDILVDICFRVWGLREGRKSGFPWGMTTRKTRAKATTEADSLRE
jgi:hypothetical protein